MDYSRDLVHYKSYLVSKMNSMLYILFYYKMGGKIRRLSMNVTFKHIWQKGLNCLTYGRIVYLYIMYQWFHDYDYHLSEMRCVLLPHLVKTMELKNDAKNKF
jgi:hypothetical protein